MSLALMNPALSLTWLYDVSSWYVVKIHSRSELATGKRKSEVAKDSGSRFGIGSLAAVRLDHRAANQHLAP